MVAGMTPTTVKAGFVSAVLSAGYHVELAGGGHYNAASLRAKVAEIQSKIPAGVGITLNSLYINPPTIRFSIASLATDATGRAACRRILCGSWDPEYRESC